MLRAPEPRLRVDHVTRALLHCQVSSIPEQHEALPHDAGVTTSHNNILSRNHVSRVTMTQHLSHYTMRDHAHQAAASFDVSIRNNLTMGPN